MSKLACPSVGKTNKLFIVLLTILTIYLLYDYKGVLEIDFAVKINYQPVFITD